VNADQHCWKACWGQPLRSSNLLSSAMLSCGNAITQRPETVSTSRLVSVLSHFLATERPDLEPRAMRPPRSATALCLVKGIPDPPERTGARPQIVRPQPPSRARTARPVHGTRLQKLLRPHLHRSARVSCSRCDSRQGRRSGRYWHCKIEVGRSGDHADLAVCCGVDKPVRGRGVIAGWPRAPDRSPVAATAAQPPEPVARTPAGLAHQAAGAGRRPPANTATGRDRAPISAARSPSTSARRRCRRAHGGDPYPGGPTYVVGRSAVRAGNVSFRLRGECRDGEPTAAVQAVTTRP
jgi:hypothetical protein